MYGSCGGTKEGMARPTWNEGIRKFFMEAVVTFGLSLERLCCSLDRSGVWEECPGSRELPRQRPRVKERPGLEGEPQVGQQWGTWVSVRLVCLAVYPGNSPG